MNGETPFPVCVVEDDDWEVHPTAYLLLYVKGEEPTEPWMRVLKTRDGEEVSRLLTITLMAARDMAQFLNRKTGLGSYESITKLTQNLVETTVELRNI